MRLGLNIGSGQRPFFNTKEVKWINVDAVEKWQPDLVCDGAHLPYSNNSVDYVVLHHVLEHFGCGEGDGLLREGHRVLRPGGSLLVFVPDLETLAVNWLDGRIDTQLYLTNLYGAYMGYPEDRHKWGYNDEHLQAFLERHRWATITGYDWRPIPGMNAAKDWWILAVEAIK